MSRLDRHVARVQGQLALALFLRALGAALTAFCGLVFLAVVVDRLGQVGVPRPWAFVWAGLGLTVVAAVAYAVARRPSAHQAAVAIDRKLGLAEKFSTALYARQSNGPADPFAAAAVVDAERTADNVSLNRQFPLAFPITGYWALIAGVALLLVVWLLPTFDLFGHEAARQAAARHAVEQAANRHQIEQAIAKVSALPKVVQNAPQVQLAKAEAHLALQQPTVDPTQSADSAMKLLQEANKANLEEVKDSQKYAEAQTNQQMMQTLNPSADDKGPVADATRDIAKGDFAKAMDKLQGLPKQFGDMAPAEQKKAAEQMKTMAAQLQNLANNPAALKNLQQQIQQMGANPQQAQQLARQVQQAVQGNPQAQQQLQQMKQQMMQQMNGGKGPTPQQQAQINKAVQQMQAAANTQQTAQQMSAAAQAMARAMQQQAAAAKPGQQATQAQPAGPKPGQQAAGGPQQASAKPGQGQQPGQKPGQQPGGGQQQAKAAGGNPQPGQGASGQQQANSGQQPGGQPGQQGGNPKAGGNQPGSQPGMAQAQQQMNESLAQMDAVQKDAQQMAAAQNAADGNGPGEQPPPPEGQPGNGGQGPGQMGPKPPGQGKGMGGPGFGAGGVGQKTVAQYTVKQEMDPSQKIDSGRMLAKTFVKAPAEKGTSIIQFTPAAAAAVKDATDDVSEESVPKEAQNAVRGYFNTIDEGAPAPPAAK